MDREAIDVGTTQLSEDEVEKLIDGISQAEWPGNSYSLLSRNCNHFSAELIGKLLNTSAPGYINRIAGVGVRCHVNVLLVVDNEGCLCLR